MVYGYSVDIIISKHAKERIKTYDLIEKTVIESIKNPDHVSEGHSGTLIAHKSVNEHLLRIVYEKEENRIKVITVYPAKKGRYLKRK